MLRDESVQLPGGRFFTVRRVFSDLVRMSQQSEAEALLQGLGQVRGARDLCRLHDRFVEDVNARKLTAAWSGALHPPIPPTPWMRALMTSQALAEEAAEMRHCAAGYGPSVAAGTYYFYAIEHSKGRATLALKRVWKDWHIYDLRGKRNATVKRSIRLEIEAWLEAGKGQQREEEPPSRRQEEAPREDDEWPLPF